MVDDAEAAAIRHVAEELLGGGSVAAAERWLRAERIPTVTGADWSHATVRDMVLKPAVAGLAVRGGQLVPAPWKAILKRPVWEQLRQLLTNPERRTSAGNAPRWLVSLFATCGICGKPLSVGGAGRGRGPAYVGKVCGHVRRDAELVDDHIAALVVARLRQPDVAGILLPPARPEVDVDSLMRQRDQLAERRAKLGRMVAGGLLDDEATIAAIAAEIAADDAAVSAQLATAASEPACSEPFRSCDDAGQVWEALSVPRRRAVVRTLLDAVVIERPARRGPGFDPDAIGDQVEPGARRVGQPGGGRAATAVAARPPPGMMAAPCGDGVETAWRPTAQHRPPRRQWPGRPMWSQRGGRGHLTVAGPQTPPVKLGGQQPLDIGRQAGGRRREAIGRDHPRIRAGLVAHLHGVRVAALLGHAHLHQLDDLDSRLAVLRRAAEVGVGLRLAVAALAVALGRRLAGQRVVLGLQRGRNSA